PQPSVVMLQLLQHHANRYSFPTRRSSDLRKAAIDEVGRHVDGDEGELETAGEEAEHQQDIGAVAERFRQRLPQRLRRGAMGGFIDRKSTRLNSSHQIISYAVFCLKKKITS